MSPPDGGKLFYSVLALGWQGTDEQWRHFAGVYLLLAGLATPLVISVHSVVSWDFAMAQSAGMAQHDFRALLCRRSDFFGLRDGADADDPDAPHAQSGELITPWHLDNLARIVLLTSLIVSYSYITESFMVWYAKDPFEMTTFHWRYFGPYGLLFWMMVFCNCVVPLALFSPRSAAI